MEAKVREDILDRVMEVLVEEKGGKKVLSKRVKRIMLSYPNVIATAESSSEEEEKEKIRHSIQNQIHLLQHSIQK